MKLSISHTTRYNYDAPVVYGLQQMRLTPVDSVHQTVLDWRLTLDGAREELSFVDQYQNRTALLQVEPGQTYVEITASGQVETHTSDGVFGKTYGSAPLWHFMQSSPRTAAGSGIHKLSKLVGRDDDLLSNLHNLSAAILEAVPYSTSPTQATTTAEEALNAGGGVCQDHAQIFVSAARAGGVPARYVSGYLMMNDRIDQDASHAWAEAYLDDLGWVGFDVSNGISPDERYVRIATGLDSHDASPLSGMRLGNSNEKMIVTLQIQQ